MSTIEQIVRITVDGDETKAEMVGTLTRCADCKHYIKHDHRCGKLNHGVKTDFYCGFGERKETEDAEIR